MNENEKITNSEQEIKESENKESVQTQEPVTGQQQDTKEQKKPPTIEELIESLAKANAENARLTNKYNDASTEAARYKKQLREKQSAEEIQTEEKLRAQEEHNKYVAELEDYKRRNEARTRYMIQGMSADFASKAADAEVKGDFDTLSAIQNQYYQQLMKQKETEWIKANPGINAGNGEEGAEKDPFVIGWNKSV